MDILYIRAVPIQVLLFPIRSDPISLGPADPPIQADLIHGLFRS